MAVFDNLKQFIRQGKSGSSRNQSKSKEANSSTATDLSRPRSGAQSEASSGSARRASTNSPSRTRSAETTDMSHDDESKTHHHQSRTDGGHGSHGKKRRYDSAVKQLIAEKNASKSKMPSYEGLDKYQLVEKMGDGAFSIVYRAVEVETGDPRAIKVVSKHNLSSSQRASVLKEAAIMRQLDHPSIVRMFAFLETAEHYFIVLELVEGGELFHQIVRLTYFSEDLSRHVIMQVAEAVRYLHEVAGVVHRDIKPENLLYTPVPFIPSKQKVLRPGDEDTKEDEGVFTPSVGGGGVGTIKLADFGLSKVIWDSKTMTPCGTVGYTAPEIVKDENYSKSVDMWALGCVLYTVLCGFPPFYDESIEVLTNKVAMGQYAFLSPWWDGISDSAKDLVSRLLTVDPEKRYTIDEFLQHPWITQAENPVPRSSEVASHMLTYSVPSTPMHERGLRDGGLSGGALKDAFDVSNAVYRQEQELLRRQKRQGQVIFEEAEEEENGTEVAHVEHAVEQLSLTPKAKSPQPSISQGRTKNTTLSSPATGSSRAAAKRAAAAAASSPAFFDLHLEGATLLEKRKARGASVAL